MRITAVKFSRALSRLMMTTIKPGALILGYHRVADADWDPNGLCVQPSNFRQHMHILRRQFLPVSLATLVEHLRNGSDIRKMAAVTFDDGYRDFIDNALPELRRLDIPATVFVTTGSMGRAFWWEEIASLLHPNSHELPDLDLFWLDSNKNQHFSRLGDRRRAEIAARAICRMYLHSSDEARGEIMKQIRAWRGLKAGRDLSSRSLSVDDVRELAGFSSQIEFASHSVTHPMLAKLEPAQQREEIVVSRACLEMMTDGQCIAGFSYPHGSFAEESRHFLMDLGFDYACTSRQAVVRQDSDPFQLPRIWPGNWGRNTFRAWLRSWRGIH